MASNRDLFSSQSTSLELDTITTQSADSAGLSLLAHPQNSSLLGNISIMRFIRRTGAVVRLNAWGLELMGYLLAIACFVASVAVLSRYDGKLNPDWPDGLTLNVVISIISTIFRTSVMLPVQKCISQSIWVAFGKGVRPLADVQYYDSASRGPLGSLQLLLHLRFRHFVCIGAVATIMILGVSPALQRTLEYVSLPVVDQTAMAQTATAYTYNGRVGALGTELGQYYRRMPYNMRTAMHIGLLPSPLFPPPPPPANCPSGNCTWDPFGTLAVGMQCADFRSHIRLDCNRTSVIPGGCVYSAANADDETTSSFLQGAEETTVMAIEAPINIHPLLKSSAWDPIDPGDITGVLSLVQWVKAIDNVAYTPDNIPHLVANTTFEAVRCMFYVAVRELSAKVTNGMYSENILREIVHADNATSQLDPFDFNGPGLHFHLYDNQSSRRVRQEFNLPMMNYQIFVSEMVQLLGVPGDHAAVYLDKGYNGSITLPLLYQSDNVTQAMETLAMTTTMALRANDSGPLQQALHAPWLVAPNQAINGTVWIQGVYIRVQWRFMVFPAAILFLVGVLLVDTIGRSQPAHIGLWKSSPLALLLHTDQSVRSVTKYEPLATADDVQAAAANLQADLIILNNGGHIVQVSTCNSDQ